MRAPVRRWVVWGVKIVLTLAVTYFLFRSLSLSWNAIAEVDLSRWRPRALPLTGSIIALLAVFAYLVALWARMICALAGPSLKLGVAVRIFFVANLGKYVPGKIWQLAGLTYLASREGVGVAVASSAAVLGQLFSLGAAAIVAALALGTGTAGVFGPRQTAWALALAGAVAVIAVAPRALRGALRLAFRLGRTDEEAPGLDPWFGARWLAIYLPAWIGYGAAFGLLWSAFPALPRVSWAAAAGAFAAAYFLGYAAVFAPAGVGVREGALALLLAPWLGATESAILAVIARLWMTAAELIPLAGIGASAFSDRIRRKKTTRDHAL